MKGHIHTFEGTTSYEYSYISTVPSKVLYKSYYVLV